MDNINLMIYSAVVWYGSSSQGNLFILFTVFVCFLYSPFYNDTLSDNSLSVYGKQALSNTDNEMM
jgi:hypothetical protein